MRRCGKWLVAHVAFILALAAGCFLLLSLAPGSHRDTAAQERKRSAPLAPGPMLEQGTIEIETPDFNLILVRSSQTVAALKPKGAGGFDFTPGDLLVERSQDGYYHLGDIDLRLRAGDAGDWKGYSTALARTPVTVLPASRENSASIKSAILASADLSPTLPADCPLQIIRTWALDGGRLGLRFELKNKTSGPVQIGALGIPMVFNNVLNERSLPTDWRPGGWFPPWDQCAG